MSEIKYDPNDIDKDSVCLEILDFIYDYNKSSVFCGALAIFYLILIVQLIAVVLSFLSYYAKLI